MKVVFYSLLFVLLSKAALAQTYEPVKLFDMGSCAELITYGTISKLDDKYYYLDCILSKGKISTLKIQRYIGRSGSFRYAKYETGQKLFVFLKKVNGEYQLYSPGIESEIPVIHDSLIVDMNCFLPKTIASIAPKGFTAEYRKMQTFTVGNKTVFGLRFSPKYLYESITAFNNCYQVLLKRPNTFPSFSCFNFFNRLTRERTETFKRKSKLMKLMFIDMEEAQLKNCK
jgi:hypothetical protein